MKYQITNMILEDPRVTAAGKSVALFLCQFSDQKGYSYPAIETIALRTGLAKRTVQRQIKSLEEKGYLAVIPQFVFGEQSTNKYYLTFPEHSICSGKNESLWKTWILKDPDFLEWIDCQEVQPETEYKCRCIRKVFSLENRSARERLILAYFLFAADQEAMAYFSAYELSHRLNIPYGTFENILVGLETLGYIKRLQKNLRGEQINIIQLCLEQFQGKPEVKTEVKAEREINCIQKTSLVLALLNFRQYNAWVDQRKAIKKQGIDRQAVF